MDKHNKYNHIKHKKGLLISQPIYSTKFITKNIFAGGQDNGKINLWDVRSNQIVFDVHEQKEAITDLKINNNKNVLISTSTEGTLGVYDLRKSNNSKEKLYALSDPMESELNCCSYIEQEAFVITGTSEEVIQIYKNDDFGDCSDRIVGFGSSIETMIVNNKNEIYVGCEDGWVKKCTIYPHKISIIDKHTENDEESMPITKLSISNCQRILATISHDYSVKFYDLTEEEETKDNEDQDQKKKMIKNVLNQKGDSKSKDEKIKNIEFFSEIQLIHKNLLISSLSIFLSKQQFIGLISLLLSILQSVK